MKDQNDEWVLREREREREEKFERRTHKTQKLTK